MKKMFLIIIAFVFFASSSAPPLSKAIRDVQIKQYLNQREQEQREKEFASFIFQLGLRESGNQWDIINQIGCMGKYQFAPSTLKLLGYGHITPASFTRDPNIFPEDLQYHLMCSLLKSNEIALKDYMHYIGKEIQGVEITKSGLLAGAHLAGARNVMLFLDSMGRINKEDANNTSIKQYIREFANFEI